MKRLAALIVVAAALSGCGGSGGANGGNGTPSTDQVKSDLTQLMLDKNLLGTVSLCVRQNGNQFICQVNGVGSGTTSVQVTDDGKTIFEQGL